MSTGARGKPGARKERDPWSLADRINFVGVVIALAAGSIAAAPVLTHWYLDIFDSPGAAITSIVNGQHVATHRIAISGTSQHIPPDFDLWLTASGDSDVLYPIAELPANGRWNTTEKQVCFRLGPGKQRLDVWMGPDTGDGSFVGYLQRNSSKPFYNVPAGFTKRAQVTILVEDARSRC